MLKVWLPLQHIFEVDNRNVDNVVFKLHYKLTSLLMAIFVLLVTFRGFLGDSINCMLSGSVGSAVPRDVLNSYCWIQGTFSIPASGKSDGSNNVVYPGVDKYVPGNNIITHKYYPWVPFFLVAQGVCFYIPSFIWKSVEDKRIEQVVSEFARPIFNGTGEERTARLRQIADYVWSYWGHLGWYASVYFACEALNFINVVVQMAVTNQFLGGALFEFNPRGSSENSVPLFPRVAKCSFKDYGPSGDIQNYSSICVLPVNIVNEVIFLFLRFHFVALAVISGMMLLFRLTLLFSKSLRVVRLCRYNQLVDVSILSRLVQVGGISEWLFLNFLSKNMTLTSFKELADILDRGLPSGESSAKAPGINETLL